MTSVAIFGFAFLDGFLPLFAFSLKNSKNRRSYIRTCLSSYPRRHVSSNGLKNSFKTMAYASRKMNWRSGSRVFVDEIRKRFRQLDTGKADTTRDVFRDIFGPLLRHVEGNNADRCGAWLFNTEFNGYRRVACPRQNRADYAAFLPEELGLSFPPSWGLFCVQ